MCLYSYYMVDTTPRNGSWKIWCYMETHPFFYQRKKAWSILPARVRPSMSLIKCISTRNRINALVSITCYKIGAFSRPTQHPSKSNLSRKRVSRYARLSIETVLIQNIQKKTYAQTAYALIKQITGVEPASSAWEANVLPMNHICTHQPERVPPGKSNV